MTKNRQSINFFVSAILLSVALVSCGPLMQKPVNNSNNSSYNIDLNKELEFTKEIFPSYSTLYFADGQGYEIKNTSSNKLLITLDGGPGWDSSRIGVAGGDVTLVRFVDWLLLLYSDYSLFVPEKFDWGRNINPFWDIKNREKYTIDNLIANYASVIREYLSQNDYETIIIAGFSEGGKIAPELFLRLKEFNIFGLISIGAGGLNSPVDIAAARRGEALDDESINNYLDIYNQYLAAYSGERYADSPDEIKFRRSGQVFIPMMWRYSLDARRPFELYKNIDIPVLFIHGLIDTNVSVISTRYVEENLPDKPFDYIYYSDMIHYPETIGQLKRLRADIANWLREKGL